MRYAPPKISVDRLLAFSAVFLSLAALVVAIFQTAILREQQRASAWPFLQVQTRIDNDEFGYSLFNFGVGPARILEVEIDTDGRAHADFESLMRHVIAEAGGPDSLEGFGWYFSEVRPGEVVPTGGEVALMRTLNSYPLLYIMDDLVEGDDFHVRIRYADVYGTEWELRDGQVEAL